MFDLSLPPLVILLLLAFLWLVLFVLLLWFAFRPRRRPDEDGAEAVVRPQPRATKRGDDGLEATPKVVVKKRSPQFTPPRTTVRTVSPAEQGGEKGRQNERRTDRQTDPQDDFDDFNRPGNRRDDFDF